MLMARPLIGLSSAAVQLIPDNFDTSNKYLHAYVWGITHFGVSKSRSNIPRAYQGNSVGRGCMQPVLWDSVNLATMSYLRRGNTIKASNLEGPEAYSAELISK